MNPDIIKKNLFLVKEHIGFLKAANNFDIYDPDSQEMIMTCREPNLGFLTKVFRFTKYKRATPFHIIIADIGGNTILEVKRGISLILSDVKVIDSNGEKIGGFKQKFFSIGGKFEVLNAQDEFICTLKGKWTGWDFKFLRNDGEKIAHVAKKWAGLGKEMFTSADNYMLEIDQSITKDDPIRKLILAAVMCIDMVLKE